MSKEISEGKEEYFEKLRQKRAGSDPKTLIWILSAFIALVLVVIGFMDWLADYSRASWSGPLETSFTSNGQIIETTYYPVFGAVSYRKAQGGFLPDTINMSLHEWIVLALILLLGIPSLVIYQREARRLKGIDDNLPYLLREIADSQRIGMTLPRAIQEASNRNYGPLTKELKKLAAKVTWGIPFAQAMQAFRGSIDTPLANQATILILEAERSGGELEKIFDSAQNFVQELLDVKRERENSMRPYIYIIYASYAIFGLVVFILFSTFFAPFSAEPIGTAEIVAIPLEAFKVAFLYMLTVQAIFSGLTAGKMGKGKVADGLIHSTVMTLIGFIIHKLFIVPTG